MGIQSVQNQWWSDCWFETCFVWRFFATNFGMMIPNDQYFCMGWNHPVAYRTVYMCIPYTRLRDTTNFTEPPKIRFFGRQVDWQGHYFSQLHRIQMMHLKTELAASSCPFAHGGSIEYRESWYLIYFRIYECIWWHASILANLIEQLLPTCKSNLCI